MPQIKLKQVTCLGYGWWHYFRRQDGTIHMISCTKEQYDSLAGKNHVNPTSVGETWVSSKEGPAFNTPTGELAENQYSNQDQQVCYVKNPYVVKDVPSSVSNGVYSATLPS